MQIKGVGVGGGNGKKEDLVIVAGRFNCILFFRPCFELTFITAGYNYSIYYFICQSSPKPHTKLIVLIFTWDK